MKKFRGKEVIGWKGIQATSLPELREKLNDIMEEYDFIDCQYSSHASFNPTLNVYHTVYSTIVLIAKKED